MRLSVHFAFERKEGKAKQYRVNHHVSDLGWVDFELDVSPIFFNCFAHSALTFINPRRNGQKVEYGRTRTRSGARAREIGLKARSVKVNECRGRMAGEEEASQRMLD